jgi:transcriptional repressor NF-X1
MFITCACQAQKQEMKCGASKASEGNNGKTLPCNEECARLERNRKLAIALNIDQGSHVEGGDHIPYSVDTLSVYAKQSKWAQTQEREFRVFADSADEKRLRFKPMQASQRAFIHLLAADFGLDTESTDPEPHRHVLVWKTPRFVSAPNKTLEQAHRIRQQALRSVAGSTNVSDNEGAGPAAKSKPNNPIQPFNGFVISKPRFGLTIDEVRNEVNAVVHPTSPFTFDIEFLPSEEVVIKALSRTLAAPDLERALQQLRNPLATAIAGKALGSLQLCNADNSLNIVRLESDNSGGDGWSRVAAKKAAPRVATSGGGFGLARNAFAMLDGSSSGGGAGNGGGGKVTFAKKVPVKRKEEEKVVVDDWEAAELAEEAREGDVGIRLEGSLPTSEGEASDVVADTQALETEVVVPVAEVTDGTSSDPVAAVSEPEVLVGATMEAEAQPTTLMADVEDSTAGEPKLDWAGEAEEAANGQS